jgi:hypothetical protein
MQIQHVKGSKIRKFFSWMEYQNWKKSKIKKDGKELR